MTPVAYIPRKQHRDHAASGDVCCDSCATHASASSVSSKGAERSDAAASRAGRASSRNHSLSPAPRGGGLCAVPARAPAPAQAGALENQGDCVSPPPKVIGNTPENQGVVVADRLERAGGGVRREQHGLRRFASREVGRWVDARRERGDDVKTPALLYCGRSLAIIGRDAETGALEQADGATVNRSQGGKAYLSGVQHCKSVHLCPVCSQVIMKEHESMTRSVFRQHKAKGGSIAFVTSSLAHNTQDTLISTIENLQIVSRKTMSSKPFRKAALAAGYIGRIRSLEVRWSRLTRDQRRGGWHPHFHILFFCEGGQEVTKEMADVFVSQFVKFSNKIGNQASENGQCAKICSDEEQAAYVSKGSADDFAIELTKGNSKKSRSRSLSPFQILNTIKKGGNAQKIADCRSAWDEYVETMPRRHAFDTSKALKERYPVEEELEDDLDESIELGTISETALIALYHQDLIPELLSRSEQAGTPEAWQENVLPWVKGIESAENKRRERERPKPLEPPPIPGAVDAKEYFKALRGGASDDEAWRRAGAVT